MSNTISSPIVVALDFPSMESAVTLAQQLDPGSCRVKVGKELFTRSGPAVLEQLHRLGFEIFLDLKYYDIPNTVARACQAAADLGVWMVNLHASGGSRMMAAAREAVGEGEGRPLLIAVTVLTSMDQEDLQELGIDRSPEEQVGVLAELAQQSGMDGVVCSPREITPLRQRCGESFRLITPGIRPAGSAVGDQKRIMTPAEAVTLGSDWLVIGRPITAASDPLAALAAINESLP